MRPRGWHLPEKHLLVDGEPVAGALFDFGLYLFHNAHELLERGSGPYFYLPKMESHLEARLWNDVFDFSERGLGLDPGTIRATVLIETLPAAFEMDEILYELRDHSAGLNAGRWDYIFSAIKCFRDAAGVRAPGPQQRDDDGAVHARLHRAAGEDVPPPRRARDGRHGGVHPLAQGPGGERGGGREACATTRAARPATASTAPGWRTPTRSAAAMEEFDEVLGGRPNQVDRQRDDVVGDRRGPARHRRDAGRGDRARACAAT